MSIEAVRSATGQVIATYDETPASDLPGIVVRAHEAFLSWRRTSFAQRATAMRRVAELLRHEEREHARRMAEDMGKPVGGGVEEVRACASLCEHFAEHAAQALANELIPTEATLSCIVFRPLGVIVGVQPWNWPYHQVFRMAVPALMAGRAGSAHAGRLSLQALLLMAHPCGECVPRAIDKRLGELGMRLLSTPNPRMAA